MDYSKHIHEKLVCQAEKKAKAEQALRNIENGRPLATDYKTIRDYINNKSES